MSVTINPPTVEQIRNNDRVVVDGYEYVAVWYPQLGGYAGKAWLRFDLGGDNRCFDAFVFHDGDFPCDDNQPLEFHHCSADQFIRLGELVNKLQSEVKQ